MYKLIESNGREMKEVLNNNRIVWGSTELFCEIKKVKVMALPPSSFEIKGIDNANFYKLKIGAEVFYKKEFEISDNDATLFIARSTKVGEDRIRNATKSIKVNSRFRIVEIEICYENEEDYGFNETDLIYSKITTFKVSKGNLLFTLGNVDYQTILEKKKIVINNKVFDISETGVSNIGGSISLIGSQYISLHNYLYDRYQHNVGTQLYNSKDNKAHIKIYK